MRTCVAISAVLAVATAAWLSTRELPFGLSVLVQPAALSGRASVVTPAPLSVESGSGHPYSLLSHLFDDEAMAERVVEHCIQHGSFRQYLSEATEDREFTGFPARPDGSCAFGLTLDPKDSSTCLLANRFDVGANFISQGGPNQRKERLEQLLARTSYFREVFAYGAQAEGDGEERAEIVTELLQHPKLAAGARRIYGDKCAIVEPYMVFANVMLPGQELGVHVDVPEFRGAERKRVPQWLLVVMHLSGLFEDKRLRIATGVSWYRDSSGGGAFVFYPHGPWQPGVRHDIGFNTAVVVDTDTVMHGVDTVKRVGGGSADAPARPPFVHGMRLERRPACAADEGGCAGVPPNASAQEWTVEADGEVLGRYSWNDIRFSVSWKAYCFADEAERAAWQSASTQQEQLPVDAIIKTLVIDMIQRGRLAPPAGVSASAGAAALQALSLNTLSGGMSNHRLAEVLVSEYIFFPRPTATHTLLGHTAHALRVFNWCVLLDILPASVAAVFSGAC